MAELGFEIQVEFQEKVNEEDLEDVIDEVLEFMESIGLGFGAGFSVDGFNGFVTRIDEADVTVDDRMAVNEFIHSLPNTKNVAIGALIDSDIYEP